MNDSTTHTRVKDINEIFRSGGRSVEFLDHINKASIVMLAETGIVPHAVARKIAGGIAQVMADERLSPPKRSADYLEYEPLLTDAIGPDASRLHTGRSRQDLSSTIARMNLRDGLLRTVDALVIAREKIIERAADHTETIIPAYTHGVQAQPTTFGHYLHSLAAALGRQVERMREVYGRVNSSPLGAAALATSSFALDRKRVAFLLGFERLLENAYDANHLAPVDCACEVAGALSISAIQLGQFAQDIHAQYSEPSPWFVLQTGELTGVSSIMPQKRNPAALEQLRAQASIMLGDMHTVYLISHNNRTGMFDYRSYDPVPCERPLQVFTLLRQVVEGIVVDKARALEEVRADYSTTTEIADALMQRADVPFRIGHHFASKLTDYGRKHGVRLDDIPYAKAVKMYEAETGQDFPLSVRDLAEVVSAEYMVFGRKGVGGPQPAEVRRMLEDEREKLTAERAWLTAGHEHLERAQSALERAFTALAGN